ncbi:hypothetical protein Tco_0330947 [Tanacetum coccineum]
MLSGRVERRSQREKERRGERYTSTCISFKSSRRFKRVAVSEIWGDAVFFEHSAFPRLSVAPEGPEEELPCKDEIEGVEGPEKEFGFPKVISSFHL